ncbi:phenylalanine--tRNA ligase subunit beta [Granulicella mallensis]|uniref:Phenylalanine--tRNA ligase beta subunit n=1 Tax=Granulicella mallensis (strain ATCC BAA-1857 / DSM 23137 / MP5ACTX8) TaxID=682795 RepID=G8P1L3_GRAMM|nr:phenylalanine--tRNA ligase subunit beta [Granulicella mallensis]AEU34752.1 phenylalanyl-tRNA synthetase, beta subunit [Granulicella mallensis MP5ACTX8]
MNILTKWLRSYLPELPVDDRQLAEDLTLRGIAVEGEFDASCGGARYEMDITTNRVDAMNHYGVAREAAAIYDVALAPLNEGTAAPIVETVAGEGFPVRIEARDLCGRFTARVIRGVTVGPAKGLVAEYFAALGQKPISAPVDVTNFGWLAMGQPTHVFDLDTLEGGIVVRRAKAGEKLRLLDGTERTLVADDLVVADEKKALGLAGVMGGWDSRVTETTKNILVEAAWFDPATIRASSRRHGLHTDASHRFERGADFNAAPLGNHLVTRLVVEQSGGEVVGPLVDVIVPELQAKTSERAPIVLRVSEVQRHLGTTLEDATWSGGENTSGLSENVVEQYLGALGCVLTPTGAVAGEYGVQLPSWRLDLEREIDLIEEVARVYGYNKFADTLPTFAGTVVEQPHAEQEHTIRETLRSLGFSEAISSTFTSAEEAATFGDAKTGAVAMGNPLSEEAGMLRPSLVPGMATMLAHNLHRDVTDVRLFEMGTVFTGSTAEVREHTGLALGATGAAVATSLYGAQDALFYEMKGAIERLLAKFAGSVRFDAESLPAWIEPGRGARALLEGEVVAVFGELSAAESQRRKLRQTCVFAEVRAELLLLRTLRQPVSREISRYQAVERDFSFVFPDAVRWEQIAEALRGLNIAETQRIAPVEIFRDAKGKAVAAGHYSALVRVVFQSNERTLTEEDLGGWSEKTVSALVGLGGAQRA